MMISISHTSHCDVTDGSIMLSEGTLIVCPASLVHQWAKEVEARCKRGSLSVIVYHGANREKSVTRYTQLLLH